jgi:glutathione transport system substrate-binding protein
VNRTRRTGIFLASTVALALLGAGCQQANSPAPQASTPSASTNQINPKPRDQVQDGGKLTWPINGQVANFNYNELDGPNVDSSDILLSALPQPFNFDAAGKPIFNKNYLVAEPTVVSDPKQVVTYKLNPKAIWYDGSPVSEKDFEAQWKALNGTDKAFTVASTTGYDSIESVTQGADQFEVVVTFKTKYADWKALFSPLYPASTNSDPKVFNTGWKDGLLTSAGPFKFQSYDKTNLTYTVVRNEKWWGDVAKLETIVYRVIEPDASPEALANGEIDFMDIGPNVDYYNKTKVISGVELRQAGGPNFRHITINGQSPLLKDQAVRQALAKAIDRDTIAKAQLTPLGVVAPTALNNHIFMSNQDGYKDNASGVVKYDPEQAKKDLDAAGWVVQGSDRVKDGKKLQINFVIPSGVATSEAEAKLVQNMLAQVNVTVNINTVDINGFFDEFITPGKFDFTVFSWIGTQFPISSAKSIYANPKGDDIQQNFARVGSPELDALFDQANAELDPAKAIDLANQADAMIWTEVHSLTLYQRPDLWAVKGTLANFGGFGFANRIYEDIGWVKS